VFCSKCGAQLNDAAKFCAECGTPVVVQTVNVSPPPVDSNKQAQWSSQWNTPTQPKTKPTVKKPVPKWIFPIIALGMAVIIGFGIFINSLSIKDQAARAALDYIDENYCSTWGDEVDSIEKSGKNHYKISYTVNQDYDLWKSTGTIELSVYKDADEWTVDVEKDNIEYVFEKNENWYYITAARNREFLIKMTGITKDKVTLEYYGYRLGSYGGPDDYDHETTTCDLKYDAENQCFNFQFMGDWWINGSSIRYNQYEVGANYEYYQSAYGDGKTLKPANPDDYWWYEKGKNQNLF